MDIKLSGWQSFGVFLSIVWFVGFAVFYSYGSRANYKFYQDLRNSCDNQLQSRNNSAILVEPRDDRVARINKNREDWRQCLHDARSLRRELSGYNAFGGIWFLYAADLGTIAFGWFVWWVGSGIWRMIQRNSN
jgi:hypothetical protein